MTSGTGEINNFTRRLVPLAGPFLNKEGREVPKESGFFETETAEEKPEEVLW